MKDVPMRGVIALSMLASVAACGAPAPPAALAPSVPTTETLGVEAETARISSVRLLIKKARITVEVDDPAESRRLAETAVEELGGYVQSAHVEKEGPTRLDVRVPVAKLDLFLDRLAGLGDVQERRIEADDVTEEVIDLDARRQNLVAVRDRLRKHLSMANDVEDILAIERELSRVQGEIESMEARLKYLRRMAAMSVVSVTLKRPTVLGPISYVAHGIAKGISKLFVIRP